MKKHKIILLIVAIAVILSISLIIKKDFKKEYPDCDPEPLYPKLIVDGQLIEDENIYVVDRAGIYLAQIPLVKVLKGLGIPVDWEDDNNATVIIYNIKYTLSLKDATLCKSGTTRNCIVKGEGKANIFEKRVYKGSQELYLDNFTMETSLKNLGLKIVIAIDTQNNAIVVENER